MDVMTLLDQAKSVGLSVEVHGERLVIKGPKRAAAIVQELARQKTAVLAMLSTKASPGFTDRQDRKADTDVGPKLEENPVRPPMHDHQSPGKAVSGPVRDRLRHGQPRRQDL